MKVARDARGSRTNSETSLQTRGRVGEIDAQNIDRRGIGPGGFQSITVGGLFKIAEPKCYVGEMLHVADGTALGTRTHCTGAVQSPTLV